MKIVKKQARMTQEYSGICLKIILVLENLSKVQIWTSILDLNALKLLSHSLNMDLNVHIWRSHRILSGPQCPYLAVPPHIIGPQCLQEPGILEILDLKPF